MTLSNDRVYSEPQPGGVSVSISHHPCQKLTTSKKDPALPLVMSHTVKPLWEHWVQNQLRWFHTWKGNRTLLLLSFPTRPQNVRHTAQRCDSWEVRMETELLVVSRQAWCTWVCRMNTACFWRGEYCSPQGIEIQKSVNTALRESLTWNCQFVTIRWQMSVSDDIIENICEHQVDFLCSCNKAFLVRIWCHIKMGNTQRRFCWCEE